MANEGKTSGIEMQDTLFGAMYEIARGVIAQQKYDITKECKIIEVYLDSKGERTGIYKVKSQDATYDAYARQGDIYNLDQWVYVQVPNGDYNSSKFIIGQKVDKDDASDVYNLKMPFDNFLGLYNLTLSTPMEEHGYWANNPTQGISDDLVAEEDENGLYYPKNGDHIWHWQNIGGTSTYATQMGIEVDITTLLHGFSLISGNYGLRAVVHGLGYDDEAKDTMKDITREYYFDTASMYGNSYAYTMGTTQQCVLDISNFLRVDSIDLWFWQDHNFRNEAGEFIPYAGVDTESLAAQLKADIEALKNDETLTTEEKEKKEQELYLAFSAKISDSAERPNIIFNNLNVLLGLALDTLTEETAYLYTYDKLKYGADGTAESGEVKAADRTLNLAWVHKYNNSAELIDTHGALESAGAKVYWYYYDPEWTPEHVNYDYEKSIHRFGGNYWHPYEIDESIVYDEYAPLEFIVTPDVQKNTSKYKAVIHYNNTYVTSNIITFANVEPVETNNANLARNDKIILRISQVRKVKDDGSTVLETDDTLGNFFVYNENNSVLTNADNIKFSDVQYFIEPWIKVSLYDSENPAETDDKYGYERLVDYRDPDTNNLLNFSIDWQFPDSMRYTMIKSWGTLDDTFRNETYWNGRTEEQFTRDVYTTRYFQISPILDAQYGNNDIGAVIDIAGMGTFNVKKELIFGQACSFGCEYTPVITISSPTGNYYIDTNSEFEMYCLVYDRQGKLLDENLRSECTFEWKYYGTRYKPADNRGHENYMGFVGNAIKGRILQPYPFVVEVTVSGAAAYDITVRRGILVSNDTEFMQTHDIMCPNRVEFRSDGQAPIYQSNAFEVAVIKEDGTENELIYPEWKINNEQVLTLVESISTYPDLVSPIGGYFDKPDDNTCYALAFSAHTLNSNSANPNAYAQQWTDDLLTDEMFTYISFTHGTATVAQGIAFAQNLYPSSLVNEWDGQSLSLDEENSAIIAKMIAAGTKDQKNRFTGVMMGDWSEKGDSSLDVPGLYGFNAGAQSFGFKTDGTGFIGPAGEGRIQFDGRNALISNSSKTCYINLNPRRVTQFMSDDGEGGYTLDSQAWNSVGNQSYSQYFLYSKAPRRVNSFGSTEGQEDNTVWVDQWDQHTDLLWVKPFMEDSENDYFLVDPNYGVATTGGIFARYGRLGHEYPWIISDYGLTQKNIFGRIFLGNPEKNLSVGTNIPTPTFTTSDGEIEAPTNFYSASFSNTNNVIQTGIRADGYLYTRFATIGGWYINDHEMYAIDTSLLEDGNISQGFRKTQKTTDDSGYIDEGYKLDLLNINSKNQFIAFNNGRFVINGKHGWMGFYSHKNEDDSYDTIELSENPSAYNMWIDFKNGTINFGKDKPSEYNEDGKLIETIPHVRIDGTDGKAYFAKGNIIIDGENAKIFCGVPTNPLSAASNYTGTLQLADIVIEALTDSISKDPLDAVFGISGVYGSEDRDRETTEDQSQLEKFSNIWSNDGSEYSVTLDALYNPNKQYYTDTSGTKYIPTFSSSASVGVGANYVTIINESTLITNTGVATNKDASYTKTFTRVFSSDLQEDDTIIDTYGKWSMDGVEIDDISTWGLSINSDALTSFTVNIVVTVSNWRAKTYYEYGKSIEDLTEFVKFDVKTITSSLSSTQITYNPTGILSFMQNSVGMQLYIEDDVKQQVLLMPRVSEAGAGLLYNWNIDALNILVQSQLNVIGSIQASAILMPSTVIAEDGTVNTAMSLVATQAWVDTQIVDKVWPKVVTVNNAASRAMQKAKAAYDLAQEAIEDAAEASGQAVTDVTVTQEASDNGMSYFGIILTKSNGSSVTASGSILKNRQIWAAHATHSHEIHFTMSGTTLKARMTGVEQGATTSEIDLDTVFVRKITADGTTGTISWEGGEGGSGNFNIADSPFYKKAAVKSAKTVATSTSTSCHVEVTHQDDTTSTYDTNKLSISGNSVIQTNSASTTVASISLEDYYTAAFNAGWNACRAEMKAYSFTAEGQKTLYSQSGETYTSEGYYYWYRRSSGLPSTTLYTRPSAK